LSKFELLTTDGHSDAAELTALSLVEVWDRVDPLGAAINASWHESLGALPYHSLGGHGFERLCYELLVAEGHSPRFFGTPGERDYGVDIVVESGASRTVYQCKNEARPPGVQEIAKAFQKFEHDWLNERGLPRPNRFVYCCPHGLDHLSFSEEWTAFGDDARERTGIEVAIKPRAELDTLLRSAPDIVAGLFSPSWAEHYCQSVDWENDPWVRVTWDEARHAPVKRFLDRHKARAIHVDARDEARFSELMAVSPVVVVRGLPGAGKTLTTLELLTRLRDPLRRIYYATLEDASDPSRLWQSVRRRRSLPSVFVLDDCHWDPNRTELVLQRLAPELSDPQGTLKLIVLLRDVIPSAASPSIDDTPVWLAQLQENDVVVDVHSDPSRTRAHVEHWRPEWGGLSDARVQHLHRLSGGDLLLLDETLRGVVVQEEIESLSAERLYAPLRSSYFKSNRDLPAVQKLACLAQFELVPLASFLDGQWLSGEKALAAPLMTELFAPPRYRFLHSSLAELVVRSLLELEVGAGLLDDAVVQASVGTLLSYFAHLSERSNDRDLRLRRFQADLETLLSGRLTLSKRNIDIQIKRAVLTNPMTRAHLGATLASCSFTLLARCLDTLQAAAAPEAIPDYADMLEDRFRLLLAQGPSGADPLGVETLGIGLRALAQHAPAAFETLAHEHNAGEFPSLIAHQGTLIGLLRLLNAIPPAFRSTVLQQMDVDTARALVNRTIESRTSIGTLNLHIRTLGQDGIENVARLERLIGPVDFMRLIVANGTIFELFSALHYVTDDFRTTLLKQLDDTTVRALVEKTIQTGRSIGTLNLALRKMRTADPIVLAQFEQCIGAPRFLQLIESNGTLIELFMILKYATTEFRKVLLDQVDSTLICQLIDKSIEAGQSVGTLNLAMRELQNDGDGSLERLQERISPAEFLRLIVANGTLVDFFKILGHTSGTFRSQLLEHVDAATTRVLIERGITSGRSVETIALAIRTVKEIDPLLHRRMERLIGARSFVRLLVANGTFVALLKVLQLSTPGFRSALMGTLDEAGMRGLIDKTIAKDRSIESIHYAVALLAQRAEHQAWLERLVTVQGWWHLVCEVGSLTALSRIASVLSEDSRGALLRASTTIQRDQWRAVIMRGLFFDACSFAMDVLSSFPPETQRLFNETLADVAETLVRDATWFSLNTSRLPPTTSEAGRTLRSALESRIAALKVEDLLALDFREAVNGMAFGWRERPDLRDRFGIRFWDILPDASRWPRKASEVAALRLVLPIARTPMVQEADAERLLVSLRSFLSPEVCAVIHTLPLMLLLWHMAAARYERSPNRSFEGTVSPALVDTILNLLDARIGTQDATEDRLAQLAMAGLLQMIALGDGNPMVAPREQKRIQRILAPLASVKLPPRDLSSKSFVPAFFALQSIARLHGNTSVFEPLVCRWLLAKCDEEDDGPATHYLRERIPKPRLRAR
jgi:hypothetical protein